MLIYILPWYGNLFTSMSNLIVNLLQDQIFKLQLGIYLDCYVEYLTSLLLKLVKYFLIIIILFLFQYKLIVVIICIEKNDGGCICGIIIGSVLETNFLDFYAIVC
jgi:hypothetical protein